MNIGLISRRFDPHGGGTERDLIVTAQMLRDAGYRVTIYADEVRASLPGWDIRGSGLPPVGRTARLTVFAMTAATRARREGADLVLSFARVIGADILRSGGGVHKSYIRNARMWQGSPAAIAMRLSPYHRAQMIIERRAFNSPRMRLAIAVSEMVRRDLTDAFGLDASRTATLYNGVDLNRFKPAPLHARLAARAEFRLPGSASVAIFVGNGFARKGLHFLIDAWTALDRNLMLLVVGSDRDMAGYRHRVERSGLRSRIVFTGPRNDIDRLFAAADFLVLPSLFEPFGNVVLEAMASGLPVLTSSRVGAAEILPESMRRFIVEDPTDVREITMRAGDLADSARTVAPSVRAAAESHTWDAYGRRLLQLLDAAPALSGETVR
jgi:UDP-glucose:(heptosyl)LPS alpha-1,3-glucosyltransferase